MSNYERDMVNELKKLNSTMKDIANSLGWIKQESRFIELELNRLNNLKTIEAVGEDESDA